MEYYICLIGINYPVAEIIFNAFRFGYDASYTRGINKSIEKSYEQHYLLEAKQTRLLKSKGNTDRRGK